MFHIYDASVFISMLRMFVMGFQVFLCVFASVSYTCFKCFICLQTYVVSVVFGCFKSRSGVAYHSLPSAASPRCQTREASTGASGSRWAGGPHAHVQQQAWRAWGGHAQQQASTRSNNRRGWAGVECEASVAAHTAGGAGAGVRMRASLRTSGRCCASHPKIILCWVS